MNPQRDGQSDSSTSDHNAVQEPLSSRPHATVLRSMRSLKLRPAVKQGERPHHRLFSRSLKQARLLLFSVALIGVFGGCRLSKIPRSVGHPLAGEAAPSFQETTISSREVGIPGSDRTKVTVVDFWASWCTACQQTIPILNDIWRDMKRDGVMVIGVSVDDVASDAASAAEQMGASFPIVVDQDLASRYGVARIPLTFVVDRSGTVRWVGRDPGDIQRAVEFVLGE